MGLGVKRVCDYLLFVSCDVLTPNHLHRWRPSLPQGHEWESTVGSAGADRDASVEKSIQSLLQLTLNAYLQTRYPPGLSPLSVQAWTVVSFPCFTDFVF